MTVRVVLADDQRAVREGLAMLLRHMDTVDLVATATNGQQAIDAVAAHCAEVVLMDLHMPVLDGVAATRSLREQHPSCKVIVLTTFDDDESVFAALSAGARGYLTKDAAPEQICAAIDAVAGGDAALDPSVQARLLDSFGRAPIPAPAAYGELPDGLTAREAEVLAFIAAGLSNTEIAAELVLSESTVKTHINRLLAKTGCRDRAQAVAYAYRTGLARP